MGKSRATKVCPYCAGKGYVSVPVDLPPDDDPGNELTRTTWVRKPCPLCDGQGGISGDDSAPPPVNGHPNSWIGPADISALSRRFGSCSLPTHCAVEREARPRVCKGKRMIRMALGDGTFERVERLVSELRAISHWDDEYWRHSRREWYETVAFATRQERRSEIIRQLLRLSRQGTWREGSVSRSLSSRMLMP